MKKLISFIGAGRRKEGEKNTYQKATYQFQDGKTFTTAIFPEALVSRNEMDIGECILIGTNGSSWGCLIENAAENDDTIFSLYEELETEFDNTATSQKTLQKLESVLQKLWNIPVQCYVHDSKITEENVLSILFGYIDVLKTTNNTDLLIDITHGFRSMPVLLMGAIQTLDTLFPQGLNLEIIYGEFKPLGTSPVRYLKPVWDAVRFARALRFFKERFDGVLLSTFLKKDWKKGAKAVERLSNMIQANFFTKFDEALNQLKNALDVLPDPCEPTTHLAAQQLRTLHQRLSTPVFFHKRLLALADLLAEQQLWGQAITTLQLALEAFVFHYYKNDQYGDYEVTKNLLKNFSNLLKEKHDRNLFYRLRNTRNAIAHGGCRSTKGGIPQETNLPSQFKSYRSFCELIFKKK